MQKDLASRVGMTAAYVGSLLKGDDLPPSPDKTDIYDKLENYFHIPQGSLAALALQDIYATKKDSATLEIMIGHLSKISSPSEDPNQPAQKASKKLLADVVNFLDSADDRQRETFEDVVSLLAKLSDRDLITINNLVRSLSAKEDDSAGQDKKK